MIISQIIGIFSGETYICGHLCVTSLLFCICSPILRYFTRIPDAQLLERQVCSVARLCQDESFLSLCHRRCVAGLSMLYKVNSNSNHCMYSELPSASTRVRHTWAAAASHPLEFEVSRCSTSNLLGLFCRLRFDCGMSYPTLCLILERWMGSRVCNQPLVASLSCVFFNFPWRWCLWGCETIY